MSVLWTEVEAASRLTGGDRIEVAWEPALLDAPNVAVIGAPSGNPATPDLMDQECRSPVRAGLTLSDASHPPRYCARLE